MISTLDKDDVYEMGQNLRLGLYAIELRPRGEKPKPWQKPSTELDVSKEKKDKKATEPNKVSGDKLPKPKDNKVDISVEPLIEDKVQTKR